jgi:hypothetical protein
VLTAIHPKSGAVTSGHVVCMRYSFTTVCGLSNNTLLQCTNYCQKLLKLFELLNIVNKIQLWGCSCKIEMSETVFTNVRNCVQYSGSFRAAMWSFDVSRHTSVYCHGPLYVYCLLSAVNSWFPLSKSAGWVLEENAEHPIQLHLTVGHQPAHEVPTYYSDPRDLTVEVLLRGT